MPAANGSGTPSVYRMEDALSWLLQIASAVRYLHSRMPLLLVHRDIKVGERLP